MALGLPSTFSQDLNIKCLATSFKYSPDDGKNWTDWYNVKIVVTITDDLIIAGDIFDRGDVVAFKHLARI